MEVDESLMIDNTPTREGGLEAVLKSLIILIPLKQFFALGGLIAFGVMQGLRMKGLIPDQDIDIVGFDNFQSQKSMILH